MLYINEVKLSRNGITVQQCGGTRERKKFDYREM